MRRPEVTLVGRTIVSVDLRPFTDADGRARHAPVFHLDDGSRVYFQVEESTDVDYGVRAVHERRARRKRG